MCVHQQTPAKFNSLIYCIAQRKIFNENGIADSIQTLGCFSGSPIKAATSRNFGKFSSSNMTRILRVQEGQFAISSPS